jgi:hypothetical protein
MFYTGWVPAGGPPLRCPQCLEYYHELERIKAIATRKGFYAALTPGANPYHDAEREVRLWLSVNRRATAVQAWRAGWARAWQLAREKLRAAELTRLNQSNEIASLRSKIGVLLTELSRLTDSGGR